MIWYIGSFIGLPLLLTIICHPFWTALWAAYWACVLCSHRAAQYACTLLGYTLKKGGAAAELHKTISQLEAHMSLTRKCEWSSHFEFIVPSTKAEGLWLMCVCVPQCCVWETLWRHWKLPRGPSTSLTVCWGSASPSATSTKPCTLPVTTSCGLEKQASSPNWISRNGVRDLLGESSFFSHMQWTLRNEYNALI